ncbi:RNA polymerase sigma factor [Paenibacillus pini]|uniref:RNA polymerase sigma factor n=1 Tax=Paenibacillus pini TaxID=669461 RepID=UPI00278BDF80|nr:sigma-70 region 4 domain-containing protein [Paenibacillus pini]
MAAIGLHVATTSASDALAILELKHEYRVILLMHHMEGKPIRLIAQELAIHEQAVAQRLVRARKKLLCQFSKKWNH